METVDGLPEGPQGSERHPPRSDGDSLVTSRALLIFLVSVGIGLLIGVSAGLAAGMTASQAMGVGVGLAAGIVAGLGATAVAALSVAGMLHSLVSKKS